jgi:hypothetical protein
MFPESSLDVQGCFMFPECYLSVPWIFKVVLLLVLMLVLILMLTLVLMLMLDVDVDVGANVDIGC